MKIYDELCNFLIKCISENYQLTLKELRAKLFNQFNLNVSHFKHICRKKGLTVEMLNGFISENKTIFYLDETNVNLFTKRGYIL